MSPLLYFLLASLAASPDFDCRPPQSMDELPAWRPVLILSLGRVLDVALLPRWEVLPGPPPTWARPFQLRFAVEGQRPCPVPR